MSIYADKNYKTKKALKDDVKAGKFVTCFQAGVGPDLSNFTGTVCIKGPYYPEPHKWYATATLENGRVIKVT